jgi:hypothetical protein
VKNSFALLILTLATGSAYADSGFYWPGSRPVKPSHRIETDEAYPDHVFVIERYRLESMSREAEYADLAPRQPITIPPDFRHNVSLLIAPRTAAEPYKSASELATAVYERKIPGVVLRDCWEREPVPVWVGREFTITYRLQQAASGDGLELVRTSSDPFRQWKVAAICLAASVVLGGLWLARRVLCSRPPTPTPPRTT